MRKWKTKSKVKFGIALILILTMFYSVLLAGENPDFEMNNQLAEKIVEDVEDRTENVSVNVNIRKKPKEFTPGTPKMGVFLEEMDFEDAYEKHYDYCYGVLISKVTDDGAARKAGLIDGDIVMEFDGQKVRYEAHLERLIKSKQIGDKVKVKYFRDGNINSTEVVLQAQKQEGIFIKGEEHRPSKHELSAGTGGFGWMPTFYVPKNKFEDVNKIIKDCGFTELDENQFNYWGIGGKGPVGKNWFLGGMGTWYNSTAKKMTDGAEKRLAYSIGYGGVTLDKRIPIMRNFIANLGFMIGWGGYDLEFSQMGENYDWNSMDSTLAHSDNNYIQLAKDYILFQPKMGFLYKLNDWLGIRAETGYMIGYPLYKGWRANICEDSFEIVNSPDTEFEGYTISVGPWFGF
ncbi:MAG: PDZ domain-containing protein [Candidatus Cloacimonetes bacterium]|nr:PDZ domain-containing protein [Candidatus Cloacimonadota bacterium]MBS3766699.1 PDZ domain-containing protein [Candidatus Cloacimonadota bacterium]